MFYKSSMFTFNVGHREVNLDQSLILVRRRSISCYLQFDCLEVEI